MSPCRRRGDRPDSPTEAARPRSVVPGSTVRRQWPTWSSSRRTRSTPRRASWTPWWGCPTPRSASSAAIRWSGSPPRSGSGWPGTGGPTTAWTPTSWWWPSSALRTHLGSVDRLLAILENLQVPLGEVRERLGIPGMGAEVARNFRDKDQMKRVFEQAGLPCARHLAAGSRGRRAALRGRCRPAVRGEAAGRLRGAEHVPGRRRRAADRLARRGGPHARRPRAARGVPGGGGALLRERPLRREARAGTPSGGTCRPR